AGDAGGDLEFAALLARPVIDDRVRGVPRREVSQLRLDGAPSGGLVPDDAGGGLAVGAALLHRGPGQGRQWAQRGVHQQVQITTRGKEVVDALALLTVQLRRVDEDGPGAPGLQPGAEPLRRLPEHRVGEDVRVVADTDIPAPEEDVLPVAERAEPAAP